MKLENFDEFKRDLTHLLNSHGIDDLTEIPDFLLAEYMWDNLVSLGSLTEKVQDWYDKED